MQPSGYSITGTVFALTPGFLTAQLQQIDVYAAGTLVCVGEAQVKAEGRSLLTPAYYYIGADWTISRMFFFL